MPDETMTVGGLSVATGPLVTVGETCEVKLIVPVKESRPDNRILELPLVPTKMSRFAGLAQIKEHCTRITSVSFGVLFRPALSTVSRLGVKFPLLLYMWLVVGPAVTLAASPSPNAQL